MSTTETISTSALEREADRMRDQVARDMGALRRRSGHVARSAGRMTRRMTHGSSRVLFGLVLARLGLALIPRPRLRRHRPILKGAIAALCGVGAVLVIRALALGARQPHRLAMASAEHETGGEEEREDESNVSGTTFDSIP